jgi:chromosome segregation ATPase
MGSIKVGYYPMHQKPAMRFRGKDSPPGSSGSSINSDPEFEKRNSDAREAILGLKGTIPDDTYQKLAGAIDYADTAYQTLKHRGRKAKTRLDDTREELSYAVDEAETLEAQLNVKTKELEKARRDKAALQRQYAAQGDTLQRTKKRNDVLEAQYTEQSKQLKNSQAQVAALSKWDEKIQSLEREAAEIQAKLRRAKGSTSLDITG